MMNDTLTTRTCPLIAMAAFAIAAVPAVAGEEDERSAIAVVEAIATTGDGDVEGHTVEISIHEGEMQVVLDGEEIEGDRIRKEEGRVIILDEHGEPIRELDLFIAEDDPGFFWAERFGPGWRTLEDFGFAAEAAEPPPVMLGISMIEVGPALEKHLGLEPGTAVMIGGLYAGLPAHRAGLEEYDVIVAFEGEHPVSDEVIRDLLRDRSAGDRVTVDVIQRGAERRATVTLDAWDHEAMEAAEFIGSRPRDEFVPGGIRVERMFGGPWQDRMRNRGIVIDPHFRMFVTPDGEGGDPGAADELRDRLDRLFRDREMDDEAFDGRIEKLDERIRELEEALERAIREADRRLRDE
jgi:hypothetical protein